MPDPTLHTLVLYVHTAGHRTVEVLTNRRLTQALRLHLVANLEWLHGVESVTTTPYRVTLLTAPHIESTTQIVGMVADELREPHVADVARPARFERVAVVTDRADLVREGW
jgi:hypothetical protein